MLSEKIKDYSKLFLNLLKTDLIIIKQDILGSILNTVVVVSALTIIFSYIYPSFAGTASFFGPFALVGMLTNVPTFTMFPFVAKFIADIEGDNSISYYTTLPISSWLIFIKGAVGHAIKTTIMSLFILPLGKLILWNRLDFSNILILKFGLMFLLINLFFGMFAIFLFSVPKNMEAVENVWIRIIFPLWFFGGSEFSWQSVLNVNKSLAYLNLLNPFVYAFEGIRFAFFGSSDFISFWLCVFMLILFSFIFAFWGIKRLKKRLDFI